MPAASQLSRDGSLRPHAESAQPFRAEADGSLLFSPGALSWLGTSLEDTPRRGGSRPLAWRWVLCLSLGIHTAAVAVALLLPGGGGEVAYPQGVRVSLILAPEAARPADNAGTSGSQPASAKPAAAPAPDPKPVFLAMDPVPAPKVEAITAMQVPTAPTPVAQPAPAPQASGEPAARAADTAPASVAAEPQAQHSDSEAIPAEWSSIAGGASVDTRSIFQARFREPPAPPGYPAESVARNQEGTVWVDLYLSDTGKVLELRVVRSSGFPRLDRAAAAAVYRWRFLPSRRLGLAMASWVRVPVHFQLR